MIRCGLCAMVFGNLRQAGSWIVKLGYSGLFIELVGRMLLLLITVILLIIIMCKVTVLGWVQGCLALGEQLSCCRGFVGSAAEVRKPSTKESQLGSRELGSILTLFEAPLAMG